jgi:hypothetical protein
MDSWNVAFIDQTPGGVVPVSKLQQYAAALQKQVDNDLSPAWDVRADIFIPGAGNVNPPGTWPIKIVESLSGPSGVHLDDQGQPYAEAVNDDQLSITLSHELLEMLVDPLGSRFIQAPDLDPASVGQQVSYLVEVADPCDTYSYDIDGVPVSDFILPSFYDSSATGKVDFLGLLPRPLTVPLGCYISWFDPTDGQWYEQQADGIVIVGPPSPGRNSRADRDDIFSAAESDRHNITAIYRSWPEAVKHVPRPAAGLPPLYCRHSQGERKLPIEKHQTTFAELFKHLLNGFHGKAQVQFALDRG